MMPADEKGNPVVPNAANGTSAERVHVLQSVQRAIDLAHDAQIRSTAAEAQGVALKELLAMHLRQFDEGRLQVDRAFRDAQEGRQRIYDKMDALADSTATAIADLRGVVERDAARIAESISGRIEGSRQWFARIMLTAAGALILAQLGLIGWLATELYRIGRVPGAGP